MSLWMHWGSESSKMPACKIYELSLNTSTLVASSRSKEGFLHQQNSLISMCLKMGAQLLIKAEISKVYISCKLSTSKLCFYHFQCFFFFLVSFFLNRPRKCLQRECIQFKLITVFSLTVISVCEILRLFDACLCVKGFAGGVGTSYKIFCGDFKNLHKVFDSLLLIGGMYSHFPRILSGFSPSFLTVEFSRYDLPLMRLGHRKGRGIHCVSWDVFLWRTELVRSQLFCFEMAMP